MICDPSGGPSRAPGRGFERREHHALVEHLVGGQPEVPVGVLLHASHHEFLVQRAAVDANPHGLALVGRHRADRGELLVAPAAGTDVARVDAVLVEGARTIRVARQQQVAVVVEVADERGVAAGVEQAALDFWHRGRGLGQVHRDAQQSPTPPRASSRHCLRGRLPRRPCRYCTSTARRWARRRRPGPCRPAPRPSDAASCSIIPAGRGQRCGGHPGGPVRRAPPLEPAVAAASRHSTRRVAATRPRPPLSSRPGRREASWRCATSVCAAERNHASNGDGGR